MGPPFNMTSPRRGISLHTVGQGVVSARGYDKMSNEEMERRLSRYSRRPPERIKEKHGGAQTAFEVLQENQQLAENKRQERRILRQNSRELIDQIMERDRAVVEKDKSRHRNRRELHTQLATGYKAAIVDRESEDQLREERKQKDRQEEYFPYVEGETFLKYRQAQREMLSGETRDFLEEQRKQHPPRADSLLASVEKEHRFHYPADGADILPSEEHCGVGSHIGGKHPRFLTRASMHMCRRTNDDHVKKALQDKTEITQKELMDSARKSHKLNEEMKEGVKINDALHYAQGVKEAQNRQRNALYVKSQIEDRQARKQQEIVEMRKADAGYYGPDEKVPVGSEVYTEHCRHVVGQMAVDKQRKALERDRRVMQEKAIVSNAMRELRDDRACEEEKRQHHQQALVATWASQQQIRQAAGRIEAIGR